ncbi:hypothetical protein KRR38_23425 [Novosphingobium sp. G106]|uniref:hypothetical protein n=1 Tax=Novosphingobium sp. G106 TaxID=2849500 RepID=UPI001C2CFC87|nr:hypothetical protein [Novosphingobium sp. G106]MBV1690544.1 hypothetical protein [Novosphingobium sp. G106]
MYKDSFATGELAADPGATLQAADGIRNSRKAALFSALVSLALLVAVAVQFDGMDFTHIVAMIPSSPLFWAVFAVWYLVGPVSEWIIYRRLWHIPVSGIGALMRKMVSNELLLGYLGEAQFYAWVRGRRQLSAAPFGAIKDVTILSALTGNVTTMAMLAVAWPLVFSGKIGLGMQSTFVSLGVVLVSSFVILLFRQKLFSLAGNELRFIAALHLVRIFAKVGLGALLWYLVLPDVSVELWLVLSTLRMLVSRLPLVPNKDVVFAGIAVVLLGHHVSVAALLAMMGGLVLVFHLVVGAGFGVADLVESSSQR